MAKGLLEIFGKINKILCMHRFTNKAGIELIKHFEGFSSNIYTCAAGYKTIGFGHKILPHENYSKISLATAEEILAKDLFRAEKSVINLINSPLTENQFAALVSFTFNIGGAALQRSTLRQKINYGNHQECSYEFLRWVYARGKKMLGLILRRHAESKLFLNSDISILN